MLGPLRQTLFKSVVGPHCSLMLVLLLTWSAQCFSSQHFAALPTTNIAELVPSVSFSVHNHGICSGSDTFS